MKNCKEINFLSSDISMAGKHFRLETLTDHVEILLCRYRINSERYEEMKEAIVSMIENGDEEQETASAGETCGETRFMVLMS